MVTNFAHRGSLTEAPENTLPAMKKALEHGTQAIELDVQLTKDKQLIVIHDHTLSRLNRKATGLIKDYTLEEIKQIDVGASFSDEYRGTSLATLDEVLELCPKEILLNIEIKNIPVIYKGIEDILLDCLSNHRRLDHIIISSFDHQALKTIQQRNSNIPIGLLFLHRIIEPWEYVKQCGIHTYSLHPFQVWTDRLFIEKSHQLGLKVFPFTVNDEKRYDELVGFGVDGVFSNNPTIFRT